jgi:hypothetical protein
MANWFQTKPVSSAVFIALVAHVAFVSFTALGLA